MSIEHKIETPSTEDMDNWSFIVEFNRLQKKMNQTAHAKGWYDSKLKSFIDKNTAHDLGPMSYDSDVKAELIELQALEDSRRIVLMHAELSEGIEGLRHGNPPSDHIAQFSAIEEELADVIIRAMDMAEERKWRLAEAIIAKAAFNKNRPHRHGNKAF